MTITPRLSPGGQLDHYLQAIARGAHNGHLLEIRYAIGEGDMGRLFIAARRHAGGRDAVTNSHLAWVEIDAADALDRLARFPRTPTMIVSSGTPGHAHAYFALRTASAPAEIEQANRTLAHLGGGPASVDARRILRPAGTLSHKRQPPAPVELLHLDLAASENVIYLRDREDERAAA